MSRVEDVLDVYHRPYDPARPPVCVDGVPVQLAGEARTPAAGRPGRPARYDYEYVRKGTANVFLTFEPLVGWRAARATDRRTAGDSAEVLRWPAEDVYADAERIVPVTDTLNTHTPAALYRAFPPERARRIAAEPETIFRPGQPRGRNWVVPELTLLAG